MTVKQRGAKNTKKTIDEEWELCMKKAKTSTNVELQLVLMEENEGYDGQFKGQWFVSLPCILLEAIQIEQNAETQ